MPILSFIEPGRYYNLTRDFQRCDFWNLTAIEAEFLFSFIRPSFRSLREKFIFKNTTPENQVSYQVIQFLSTSNTREMCNLGKYSYYANKRHTLDVNNQNWLIICTHTVSNTVCIC